MTVDHARNVGRPVLVIGEDGEYFYYLTLTSQVPGKKIASFHRMIDSEYDFLKPSYVNLKNIYRHEIFGYEEYGQLMEDDMLNIVDDLIKYQTSHTSDEYFQELLPIMKKNLEKYQGKQKIK